MRSRSDWQVIVAYALVCAATQMLWLTYALITTETATPLRRVCRRRRMAREHLPAVLHRARDPRRHPARPLVSARARGRRGAGRPRRAGTPGRRDVRVGAGRAGHRCGRPSRSSSARSARSRAITCRPSSARAGSRSARRAALWDAAGVILGPTVGGSRPYRAAARDPGRARRDPRPLALVFALRRPGRRAPSMQRSRAAPHARSGGCHDAHAVRLVFVGFGIFVGLATWLQALLAPAGVSEAHGGRAAGRDGARRYHRLRGAAAARRAPPCRARLHARRGARRLRRLRDARRSPRGSARAASRSSRSVSCCCQRCR